MGSYQAMHPDDVYLSHGWNDGDFGGDERAQKLQIVRNRKPHTCISDDAKRQHQTPAGERMLVWSAIVDGEWRGWRMCLKCCDDWLLAIYGEDVDDDDDDPKEVGRG